MLTATRVTIPYTAIEWIADMNRHHYCQHVSFAVFTDDPYDPYVEVTFTTDEWVDYRETFLLDPA